MKKLYCKPQTALAQAMFLYVRFGVRHGVCVKRGCCKTTFCIAHGFLRKTWLLCKPPFKFKPWHACKPGFWKRPDTERLDV